MRTFLKLLLPAMIAGLIAHCTGPTEVGGGAGGETTNGFAAVIRNANGTPARNARVRLRPADFLAGTIIDTSVTTSRDTITDSTGRFVLTQLKPGDYAIEVEGDSGTGVLLREHYAPDDSVRELGSVSLQRSGNLQGHVQREHIADSVHVVIRFYGLDRTVTCLSDGRFAANQVPASMYTLRITTDRPEIGTLDVPMVSVTPGQSTTLSTISLPIDYAMDSLAVRAFLTKMGIGSRSWDSTVSVVNNRIRRLNLSGLGLTSLDSTIDQLDFLWGLRLGANSFSSLPQTLTRLPILTDLDLGGGPLDSLFTVVTELPFLASLDLDHTGLKSVPPSMANMSKLGILSIRNCGLDSIPPEIYLLTSLTTLNLDSNAITYLSPRIGNLPNLTSLGISDNLIGALPEEIGNLTRLVYLYAYRNRIAQCPSTIGGCAGSLTVLNLESNLLTSIPAEIGALTHLTLVSFGYNQLTTLPDSLTNLKLVTTLGLGGNKLCTLSPAVEQWVTGILDSNWRTTSPQVGCP